MKYAIELAATNHASISISVDDANAKATLDFTYRGEPAGSEEMAVVDNVVSVDEYKAAMGSLIVSYILNATFYENRRLDHDDNIKATLSVFGKALHAMVPHDGLSELTVGKCRIQRPDSNSGPFAMVVTGISNYSIHKELNTLMQIIRQLKLRSTAMMDIFQVEGETWVAEYGVNFDMSLLSRGVDLTLRRDTVVSTTCEDEGIVEIHSNSGILIRCDRLMNFESRAQLENIVMEYRDKGKS